MGSLLVGITLKDDKRMNKKEMKEYIEYVLINNVFSHSDVIYYRGESRSNRLPHGINKKDWNEIANKIGFDFEKLTKINDKYFISLKD